MLQRLFLLLALLPAGLLYAQRPEVVHRKATVIDTHNDVLSSAVLDGVDISHKIDIGHSDLDRWEAGRVDVQFFSVWTGPVSRSPLGPARDAHDLIDSLELLILKNYERMTLARNYREIKKGMRQNKFVALIGVEGGHMIENDISILEGLYRRGMRYLTLTWNNSIPWASSAMDETLNPESLSHKGLNDFGRQVVKRMNELGIIVDLSHTGEQTFYDAIAVSTKPVLLSHSSVWAICPVFRNLKDDQIKAVAKNGGVICINFYSGFISAAYDQRSSYLNGPGKSIIQDSLYRQYNDSAQMKKAWQEYYHAEMERIRPGISELVDHIEYITKLVGVNHVGIGADYDGVGSVPRGLEDVSSYPRLTAALLERGYSSREVKKIMGGNVMRVMKANFR